MSFTVAILTVSDTAFADAAADRSGPALRTLLAALPASPYTVVASEVVADEPREIQRVVQSWCEADVDLVLTTGGTGFGVRDRTPEALSPLIDKPAPGLVTLMLTHSLAITPMAALSRPVAGVRLSSTSNGQGSLIVTLPGSPKGATENLQSLLRVLPHALELTRGGSGRETHAMFAMALAEEALSPETAVVAAAVAGPVVAAPVVVARHHHHSHDHHHHGHAAPKPRTLLSQDPSSSVANRQRHSPYPLVPVRDALDLILAQVTPTPVQTLAIDEKLVGFVLAESIVCERNIPERSTTSVDGYAVRSTDASGIYTVVTEYPTSPLPAGSIYRINTGAPLPPGADAIIMVEDTVVVSRDDSSEETEVELLAQVEAGENMRGPGTDVREGDQVLDAGDVVSAVGGELGTLAFVGRRSAKVHRRPTIAVLSTGNELVSACDTTTTSKSSFSLIPDSNRPSLLSILSHLHYDTIDLGIVGDTMEATTKALKKGREEADVVITTGGTSMGVSDLLKPCIERELKGVIHFGRVAMKPGKPTTFATLPAHPMAPNQSRKLVFALPGNPASALVTFFLFVLPALRKMEGRREADWELPRISVELASPVRLDSRPEYHRVMLRPKKGSTALLAFSTGSQRSSRTVSLAGSNGLLELPEKGERDGYEAGEIVQCVIIGDVASLA